MPEEDPGDVFLRHRGAVLDALLSTPTPKPDPAPDKTDSAPAGPSVTAPTADSPPTSDIPRAVDPAVEPIAPTPVEEPARKPRPGGHKPSDRINALLSGRAMPEPDYVAPAHSASQQSVADIPVTQVPTESRTTAPKSEAPPEPDKFSQMAMRRSAPMDEALRKLGPQLRRPKVLLAIGAVIAALLLLLLIATSGGGDDAASGPVIITPSAAPAAKPKPAGPSGPEGNRLKVKTATSHCPPGSTSAMDAFDSQSGAAWSCVRAYHVDGQVLTIELDKSYSVDSVSIVPGWDHVAADGSDEWTKHRTASKVSYEFNDPNATTYTQETLDQRKEVTTKIDPPVSASRITLTILKSSGDKSLNDTAVSSIIITGH